MAETHVVHAENTTMLMFPVTFNRQQLVDTPIVHTLRDVKMLSLSACCRCVLTAKLNKYCKPLQQPVPDRHRLVCAQIHRSTADVALQTA